MGTPMFAGNTRDQKESLKSVAIQAWLDVVYGGQDTKEWAECMRVIRKALEKIPENIRYRPEQMY